MALDHDNQKYIIRDTNDKQLHNNEIERESLLHEPSPQYTDEESEDESENPYFATPTQSSAPSIAPSAIKPPKHQFKRIIKYLTLQSLCLAIVSIIILGISSYILKIEDSWDGRFMDAENAQHSVDFALYVMVACALPAMLNLILSIPAGPNLLVDLILPTLLIYMDVFLLGVGYKYNGYCKDDIGICRNERLMVQRSMVTSGIFGILIAMAHLALFCMRGIEILKSQGWRRHMDGQYRRSWKINAPFFDITFSKKTQYASVSESEELGIPLVER